MLEISPSNQMQCRLGFGGDTLNTAVYLARSGAQVDYLTALGDDPFSKTMLAAWAAEGIGTEHVFLAPNSQPGLYMIQTDACGERSFYYWRDQAPARRLFEYKPELLSGFGQYEMLYLSGITLSLYSDSAVAGLMDALDRFRAQGGRVAFDINYRPRNWPDVGVARDVIAAMLKRTDIALPSFDDEQLLYGPHSPETCIERYRSAGATEVVLKQGIKGCLTLSEGTCRHIAVDDPVTPVDTTAAGDSFNGAYLAVRLAAPLTGSTVQQAVAAGQACAAIVIQHRGAIIDRQYFPGVNA